MINKIHFALNFENPQFYFLNPRTFLFVFVLLHNTKKEKMFTIKIEDGREAPLKPSSNISTVNIKS